MRLSKNFTLSEMTKSQTAQRLGIENNPDELQIENMRELSEKILQPIRDEFGPVRVTSGLRVPELNTALSGSKYSQHCKGEAADIDMCSNVCDKKNAEVFAWIVSNLIWDQMIWEFGNDSCPDWIHISYSYGKNRREVLKAVKKKGKTSYINLNDVTI